MTQAAADDEAIVIISEKILGMERLAKRVEALLTQKSPIAAWVTWMGAKLEQMCGTNAGIGPTTLSGR